MARGVGHLVGQGGVIGAAVPEGLEFRHLYVVEGRGVKGLVPAVADVDAARGKKAFRMPVTVAGWRTQHAPARVTRTRRPGTG